MIIQDSRIAFEYSRTYSESFSASEQLFVESSPVVEETNDLPSTSSKAFATERSKLSERGVALAEAFVVSQQNNLPQEEIVPDAQQGPLALDAKLSRMKALVESFTGKAVELSAYQTQIEHSLEISSPVNLGTSESPQMSALIYRYSESYLEQESSLFTVKGNMTFTNGESIDVDFSQYTQREFYDEVSLELAVGEVELVDPLVINLQGNSVQLTEQKYQFDLTANGKNNAIHFATGQSGFLAIDNNANGNIDDGSELFGALTGNGFKELAAYDTDNNGFIDSADTVYEDLLFYQKEEDGEDKLMSLTETGIGALYLGYQSTPLNIKSSDNELQGQVKSSSFFIYEDKTLGTTQQIDLVI